MLMEDIKIEHPKKYYFVSFCCKHNNSVIKYYNGCTDKTPINYILDLRKENVNKGFTDFVILNVLEITEEEYNKHKDNFF